MPRKKNRSKLPLVYDGNFFLKHRRRHRGNVKWKWNVFCEIVTPQLTSFTMMVTSTPYLMQTGKTAFLK